MYAEIVSIGDELTSGYTLDTNSQWLSRELSGLGITTRYHSTVADEQPAIVEVLRIAISRADIVIVTGGLGPTADDLTRAAIAELLGVPLEKSDILMERIRAMFEQRGREMPKSNEQQAFIPRGAVSINNPNGTAPGIDVTKKREEAKRGLLDRYRLISLPGVPAEMKEMWAQSVKKSLEEMIESLAGSKRVLRALSINCFGQGESQIEAMLPDIVNRSHYPRVGITANGATITLRIFGEGNTEAECFESMRSTRELIHEKLGNLIFAEGDDRLQEVCCRILNDRKKTLSVIEWGSRGLLTEALAGSREPNERFLGGIVLTSLESLKNSIRFSRELTSRNIIPEAFTPECVVSSPETTKRLIEAMAMYGRVLTGADYVLAVGPYPPPGAKGGTVYVAFGDSEHLEIEGHLFGGHPALMDELFTKRAMNLMRKMPVK